MDNAPEENVVQYVEELTDINEEGEEEEGNENEIEHVEELIIEVDEEKLTKKRSGPALPKSAPDLTGLSEGEITAILQRFSDDDIEDLFAKNTESFRCLTQILVSRSSVLRQILYRFPELKDPGIDEAFEYVEPEPQFDNVGIEKYKSLCRDMNIGPISRVIRSMQTETLNLKYYSLTDKQWKAIANSLMLNTYIKHLILQDNWFSPDAALLLGDLLRENNTIKILNLRECRLGPPGILNCIDGLSLSQSLRELDLSYNDLGDEGVQLLVEALKDNYNIEKLNLGHNNLGELSGTLLGGWLKGPNKVDFLDLSWNNFYEGSAMKNFCEGINESDTLVYLNLSWNGISTPQSMIPIVKFLKANRAIEHLDLSFNRIMGELVPMVKSGIIGNQSLKSINLGFNLITPTDAIILANTFQPEKSLEYMDLQNVFVNKNFIPVWQKLTNMGKSIRIEGIIGNYSIAGPDKAKVIFDRCRFLAQKPKKQKQKKDFGSHFIWNLKEEVIDKTDLKKLIKKSKIKLDNDLIEILGDTFCQKKKKVDLKFMRDSYLEIYPDTEPPPPPEKKKKGKKKKEFEEVRPSTEEKGIGTDSLVMMNSSFVTSKMPMHSAMLPSKSAHEREPVGPEKFVSAVTFGGQDIGKSQAKFGKSNIKSNVIFSRPSNENLSQESIKLDLGSKSSKKVIKSKGAVGFKSASKLSM